MVERGLRSGTVPTTLAVGLGAACEVAQQEMKRDLEWISYLSERLEKGIRERCDYIELNGDAVQRYHGNLNVWWWCVVAVFLLTARCADFVCVCRG